NELAALRRAFAVAVERRALRRAPRFPTIKVKNARDVFHTTDEYERVKAELPAVLRNLWTVVFWTGWRREELFGLRWRDVDWEAGTIRVGVNIAKNDEGREVPFGVVPALVTALEAQRDYTRAVERRLGHIVEFVFHRNGRQVRSIDAARRAACRRAGVIAPDGRPQILHDMRRTAARNLTRAGVARHIAMKILGLKTEEMWRRYAIMETDDLRDGMTKVVQRHAARRTRFKAAGEG
ncbi:MAG: tyrosine-type recombinase/integrase, partial [Gemmatimonadota bacterium]|nr:tyrosine-type recombinase/integrase [Gemmatimonadota bacterium]